MFGAAGHERGSCHFAVFHINLTNDCFYTYEFPRTPVFLEEENVWLSVTDANYLPHFKLSWGKIGKTNSA